VVDKTDVLAPAIVDLPEEAPTIFRLLGCVLPELIPHPCDRVATVMAEGDVHQHGVAVV